MLIALLLIPAWSCVRYTLVGNVLVGVMHGIGNMTDMVVADGGDVIFRQV